ncbi:hypothetical protein C8R43DRAFT_886118 [Mycena crocata]|nr:hypothetical protein C8R43DRAFT_886118 [Mycena crocata]
MSDQSTDCGVGLTVSFAAWGSSSQPEKPHHVPSDPIDFSAAGLPEYEDCYAIVLDSVLSKPELSSSCGRRKTSPRGQLPGSTVARAPRRLAFVDTSYRNGQFKLSQKLFSQLRPHFGAIEEIGEDIHIRDHGPCKQRWHLVRLNERLRFLRYPTGGFFGAHEDIPYFNEDDGQQTFYTVQLYLPSDSSGTDESFLPPQGGTTRFLSREAGTYADVEAIPGRFLVFQHAELLHTGEEVTGGVKCAVRSDILYEKVGNPIPAGIDRAKKESTVISVVV